MVLVFKKWQQADDTPHKLITNADYADDLALLVNTPTQAKSLLYSLEQPAGDICLHVNTDKTEYMSCNQKGDIATLNNGSLKLLDKFTYLRISSTENDISIQLAKTCIAIGRLSIMWMSDFSDKIKRNFFPAAVVSILLHRCTPLMLTERMEKNLDGNCSQILLAISYKSWKQHPTKQQLYVHLPPILHTIVHLPILHTIRPLTSHLTYHPN